jgi:hypothetical protein
MNFIHVKSLLNKTTEGDAKYIFPASITIFGDGPATGKVLTMRAIEKYYPELINEWQKLFAYGYQISNNYAKSLQERISAIQRKYNIPDRILT